RLVRTSCRSWVSSAVTSTGCYINLRQPNVRPSMKALAVSVLVALAIAPPTLAHGAITPPPAAPIPNKASALKANDYAVAVTGCIRGKHLRASDLEGLGSLYATLRASEFILQGPRELMQQIKDSHDGDYDRVEGIVTVPAAPNGASSTS